MTGLGDIMSMFGQGSGQGSSCSHGGGNILDSLIHGVGHNLLLQRPQTPGWSPQFGPQPGGAPYTPATTPGMAYSSQAPATDPKTETIGNAGGGLHINAPMSGVMAPDAAAKFV